MLGIKKGKEVQAKSIANIFNKFTSENFPNLEKEILIQVQEASRKPNRHDQSRIFSWYIILKTISTEKKKE
jgi:hypothetical protein